MKLNFRALSWKKVCLFLAVVGLVLWGISRLFAWSVCEWYGFQTGRETRYAAFIGCMVQTQNQWVPRTELRVLQ